jgi:hypothetical protein
MNILLSYSHKDKPIVDETVFSANGFTVFSANGFNVWVDATGLTPGTAQWDQAIRTTISEATSVIVICCPHACDSNHVAIDLAIASDLRMIIHPASVQGESWPQSAPMSLVLSQHVDIRAPSQKLASLMNQPGREVGKTSWSEGSLHKSPFIKIEHEGKSTAINPFSFPTWGDLFTKIYVDLLTGVFPRFSYDVGSGAHCIL